MGETRLHLVPNKTEPSNLLAFPAQPLAPIPAFLSYVAVERRLSQNTIKNYETDLMQISEMLPCTLAAATRDQLRHVLSELQAAGRKSRTLARKISVLRHFYTWARRKGLVSRVPLANIPLPKIPLRVVKPITDSEFAKILAVIDERTPEGLRNLAIVRVLDACGLRASELINLTLTDLHLDERYITVFRTKFDKDRSVPIDEAGVNALRDYLARSRLALYSGRGELLPLAENPAWAERDKGRQIRWGKAKAAKQPDKVFPITRQRLQQIIRQLSRQAGLPVLKHPHQLRHRLASGLIEAGMDVALVRDIMGHSCTDSTVRSYVHLNLNFAQETFRNTHPRAGSPKK